MEVVGKWTRLSFYQHYEQKWCVWLSTSFLFLDLSFPVSLLPKTMSKKAGKSAKEVSSYETHDVVLGKVRGYPPWPGMIVDPDNLAEIVLKERPTTKKTHFYCVRFFPTGDFAWLVSKDISKLQTHEIQAYINEPFKKSGELLQGYRIALDPSKWIAEREAQARLAAEEEANAEVDQLESENDGSGDLDEDDVKAKRAKKRKRDSDAPSTSTKAKKAPKKTEPKQKKATSSAKGTKRNGAKKSNAMVESEEEDGDHVIADGDPISSSKKGSPPPLKRQKRGEEDPDDAKNNDPEALKVRDWRHKLQKTFLSHKGLPKDEEMPGIDALFTTVENYDKITIEYLQFSKIGKVMRHIAVLADEKVPRNAEFKFKERADALVKKWQQILNANKPANGSAPATGSISAGPISAIPGSLVKEDTMISDTGADAGGSTATVTQATSAIDLNGKVEEAVPASTTTGAEPPAATSNPESSAEAVQAPVASEDSAQDVTMGEAA
ncbi:hypothetical protein D9756_010760 [Leucocoprinus leucothites]|uniref:PWWP domain-containing protein n=1 Tax=Leucocoprinus leucothites TaxID=201217 RepID=A0A8H5FTE7_9AGAR|nr:hypothetical protein D9756_010760 [Leucoagaricus leucothites]